MRGFASRLVLGNIERDGAYSGVPAAAVALANLRQVDDRFRRRPGIRSDRNFHPETALAQAHAVDGFRLEVVGDKFVVSLEVQIRDIEKECPIFQLHALTKNLDGTLMSFEKRRQKR